MIHKGTAEALSILIFLTLPCFLLPTDERLLYFLLVLPWTFLSHSVLVIKNKNLIQRQRLPLSKSVYTYLIFISILPIVFGTITFSSVFDSNTYFGSYSLYTESTLYHAFLFFSYAGAILLGYAFPRTGIDYIDIAENATPQDRILARINFKEGASISTSITWIGRPLFGALIYLLYYALIVINQ